LYCEYSDQHQNKKGDDMSKRVHLLAAVVLSAVLAVPFWGGAQDSSPVKVETYPKAIKLACVGDSITQGVGAKDGMSWPAQISVMLGGKWEVKNFGVSGTTLLKSGDKPYQKTAAFAKAKEFNPDVVVVILGTNDTKPQNWKNKDQFEADYKDLVKQFAELPSKPRIFICYPPYIARQGHWGINEPNTKDEMPMVDSVAKEMKVGVIDVHGALIGKDALIPDRVHPNTEGATEIAKVVFKALTGKKD
jgi:lysophospholipase L1-like esterase